jgi:microcystin-dependent protein
MPTAPPPRLAGNEDAHAKILLDYVQRLFNSIKNLNATLIPIGGGIIWYHPTTIPAGFLEANGQEVSRAKYPDLYTAIGGASSPWGQGDGSTTFNLPNEIDAVTIGAGARGAGFTPRTVGQFVGEETHTLTAAELPTAAVIATGGALQGSGAGLGANAGGGKPHNVMQPSVVVRKLVRAL